VIRTIVELLVKTVLGAVTGVEVSIILHVGRLGVSSGGVSELPADVDHLGRLGAIIDLAFELSVRATVHASVLGKDVDGVLSVATKVVSEDVSGIAVLDTIVIEHARVGLGAGSGASTVVKGGRGNSTLGGGHDGLSIVHGVGVGDISSSATFNQSVASRHRARDSGAHAGGVGLAGKHSGVGVAAKLTHGHGQDGHQHEDSCKHDSLEVNGRSKETELFGQNVTAIRLGWDRFWMEKRETLEDKMGSIPVLTLLHVIEEGNKKGVGILDGT